MIAIFQLTVLTYFPEAIPAVGKVSHLKNFSGQLTL